MCFPSPRGCSRADGMGCLPGRCRRFESGLATGSQLWEPQESGCRNLGLCFRNSTWKGTLLGGSRKTVRNPSSHLRSAQRARQGSRRHRPSWLKVADGSRPPCRGSHPFPTRAPHGTIPTPGPPARAPGGSCSTPQPGRDSFLISSHLFLICGPRSALTAHGRAERLTLHGERSKERSSRDGRRGGGEAGSGAAARAAAPAPASGAGRPGAPGLTFWGSA